MKGSELQAIRLELGLTLLELGDLIGRSEGAMSKYENGKTPIPSIVEKAVRMQRAVMAPVVSGRKK